MGLTLLFQTTFISILSGLIAPTFWFSYILFLVFLGGMLVLFIYVTSLASNEMFSISSKSLIFTLLFITLVFIICLLYDHIIWLIPSSLLNESTLLFNFQILPTFLFKLYNTYSCVFTIILISYLFLTLVVVVSITNIFHGPLRSTLN